MSKVDWSLAPEGATHYCDGAMSGFWRDLSERTWKFYRDSDGTWHDSGDKVSSLLHNGCGLKLIARPQPKPWSGPEDGFPPVNSVCEFVSSDTSWGKVKIIAHDEGKVVFKPSGDSYYGVTPDHKAVFRPLIDTEQKRESAIRELMDIAQVDCRVTAARLVDAGFKREVV